MTNAGRTRQKVHRLMNEPDPAVDRPTLADGTPVISLEQRLEYEVQRAQARLDAAQEDLRNWRLSNG